MKLLKSSVTVFLLGLFIFGLGQTVEAQDRKKAVQTYNSAREMVQNGDYQKAIEQFKKAIEVGSQLGPQGSDIVERAEAKLPEVYRQIALDKYRAFKQDQTISNLDATIDAFQETKEVAAEYDNSQVSNQANGVINQLLYSKSIIQYKQQNYQDALTTLDEVIANDSNYAKAYYQKGIVLKKVEGTELERSIDLFDQAIEVGEKTDDSQIVSRARNAARDELIYRGAKATEQKNFSRAKELLNRSLDYDSGSADAHYRLAQAYNKTQDWQQAVQHSEEALSLETGGRTDKAKIYFELGTAYQGLGQKENACNAYNNAAYGNFKSPAEHAMEYELKCESATG